MKYLLIILIPVLAFAQWSAPIQVTNSTGDDHHVTGQMYLYWPDYIFRLAWVSSDGHDSHIYACDFQLFNGVVNNLVQITSQAGRHDNPDFICESFPEGLVFQSDESGLMSLWFSEKTESGYSNPAEILYSTVNLFNPVYRPQLTDYTQPVLFFQSDSSADYWFYWDVPTEPEFWYPWLIGYPVHSFAAYWTQGSIITASDLRWAWEYTPGINTEIGYYFEISSYGMGVILEGNFPNPSCSYHRPQVYNLDLFCEREIDDNFDIVSACIDSTLGGFNTPQLFVEDLGNEKNPTFCDYELWTDNCPGLAFEHDWNGNWNIGFQFLSSTTSETVDLGPADDRNPFAYFYGGYIHLFWESNRDGNWNIYYAYRDAVGIEPEPEATMPREFGVSVHPNPGNAQFTIELDLPVTATTSVAIFDLSGKQVQSLHQGDLHSGKSTFSWNAVEHSSGIYFVRAETDRQVQTSKLVLLK